MNSHRSQSSKQFNHQPHPFRCLAAHVRTSEVRPANPPLRASRDFDTSWPSGRPSWSNLATHAKKVSKSWSNETIYDHMISIYIFWFPSNILFRQPFWGSFEFQPWNPCPSPKVWCAQLSPGPNPRQPWPTSKLLDILPGCDRFFCLENHGWFVKPTQKPINFIVQHKIGAI